ncbi:GntR family transcriptional regulator [Planomicrobium sp. Y74]|uniref:GntR family transcriptional regulator n=1 Tax=Planomicrobium sp. Y74 TaxID=2478977 RepID=UPI00257088FB|nr:GntR family transcriptional regulator [Planomicrobium sp. Y74]
MRNIGMKPVAKKRTTKEIVYDELRKAIFSGSISSKEILTETMLADSLQTSRTPVREAVASLISEGLLVHIPRKGVQVRQITEGEKEQIMFLRISIESEGLRKLAVGVKPEQIEILRNIIEKQKQAIVDNNKIEFIELDQKFHRQILKFSNQNVLSQILQDLYNLTRLIGHHALMKTGRMEEVIDEHSIVIDALEQRDGEEAVSVMAQHLERTKEIVKAGSEAR